MAETEHFRADGTNLSTIDNISEMNWQLDCSQILETRSPRQNEEEQSYEEQTDNEQSQFDDPDDSRSDRLRTSTQTINVDLNAHSGMENDITLAKLHGVSSNSLIADENGPRNGHSSQIPSLTSSQGSRSPSSSNTLGERCRYGM